MLGRQVCLSAKREPGHRPPKPGCRNGKEFAAACCLGLQGVGFRFYGSVMLQKGLLML